MSYFASLSQPIWIYFFVYVFAYICREINCCRYNTYVKRNILISCMLIYFYFSFYNIVIFAVLKRFDLNIRWLFNSFAYFEKKYFMCECMPFVCVYVCMWLGMFVCLIKMEQWEDTFFLHITCWTDWNENE